MGKGVCGREAGDDICILITHSQCCIAETNNNVNQISSDHHYLWGKKNYHMTQQSQYRMDLTSPRENHKSKTHVPTVHCGTIYNSQDMESTRFSSTDEWIIRCGPT